MCELHAAVLKVKPVHTAAEGKGCPKDCNGRGKCNMFGSCECNDGFSGRDCGVDMLGVTTLIQATEGTAANSGCSVHGLFIGGTCLCDLGYSGDDCSTQSSSGSARGSSDKAYWKQEIKKVWSGRKTGNAATNMMGGFPRFDNVFGAGNQQANMMQAPMMQNPWSFPPAMSFFGQPKQLPKAPVQLNAAPEVPSAAAAEGGEDTTPVGSSSLLKDILNNDD